MKNEEYKKEVTRTFAYRKEPISLEEANKLHCAIGASTEAGELLDAFKKSIYYGRELNVLNVGEEIADILWYLHNLCNLLNLDIEQLMENNIKKLRVRFPEKFTTELAFERNLDEEEEALKGNS